MEDDPSKSESPDRILYTDAWNDDILNFLSTVKLDVSTTTIGSENENFENLSSVRDEYPDYDVESSHKIFDWAELIPTLVIYSIIFVLGLVGNLLMILTIARYRKMKSTTNVFLCSLASADLLLILFCIPVKLAKLFSFAWTMGLYVCKIVYYMQTFSAVCSVLTLTAMSIERYYAIAHPMRAQYVCTISQATKIIIATWISAFLLAIPVLFVQVHQEVGHRITAYWCVRDFENRDMLRAHELYMMLLILVIPTSVMGVAYTAICLEVWEVTQRREGLTAGRVLSVRFKRNPSLSRSPSISMTYMNSFPSKNRLRRLFNRQPDDDAPVKQVIKMLVAVVVIYVVCWGPMLIENVLVAYGVLEPFPQDGFKYMKTAFQLMAYFNSCINPVIYGFMSKNFRDSFRNTLCCRPDTKVPTRTFSISQTRNSSIRYAESSLGRTVSIAVPD